MNLRCAIIEAMKKRSILIGLFLLLLLLVSCQKQEEIIEEAEEENSDIEEVIEEKDSELQDFYDAYKAINADYAGFFTMENGSIHEPCVFALDDSWEPLKLDLEGKEDSQGTVTVDFENSRELDDQNITLYGHYVYYDENAKFTPLEKLLEEENYEAYKNFSFQTRDEIRNYTVAYVYYYHMETDKNIPYYVANLGEAYAYYFDYLEEAKLYDTGIHLSCDDEIMTLQTCVRNHDELREIIVAKRVK